MYNLNTNIIAIGAKSAHLDIAVRIASALCIVDPVCRIAVPEPVDVVEMVTWVDGRQHASARTGVLSVNAQIDSRRQHRQALVLVGYLASVGGIEESVEELSDYIYVINHTRCTRVKVTNRRSNDQYLVLNISTCFFYAVAVSANCVSNFCSNVFIILDLQGHCFKGMICT